MRTTRFAMIYGPMFSIAHRHRARRVVSSGAMVLLLLSACGELTGLSDRTYDRGVAGPGEGGAGGDASGGEATSAFGGGGVAQGGSNVSGGSAGRGGTSTVAAGVAGVEEAGNGGNGGEGGAPNPDEDFGVMQVLVDDQPSCAAVALANHWLLTATDCLPPSGSLKLISVQTSAGPKLDATAIYADAGVSGRGVALLHTNDALSIGRVNSGFLRSYFPRAASALDGARLVCVTLENVLQASPELVDVSVDSVTANAQESATAVGDRVWLPAHASADSHHGAACFEQLAGVWVLAALELGVPAKLPDDSPNDQGKVAALGLSDAAARTFIDSTLLGYDETNTEHFGDRVTDVFAYDADTLGVVELPSDHEISLYRYNGSWQGPDPLPSVQGAPFPWHRPAVAMLDGSLELVIQRLFPPDPSIHWHLSYKGGQGTWEALDYLPSGNFLGSSLTLTAPGTLGLFSIDRSQGVPQLFSARYTGGATFTEQVFPRGRELQAPPEATLFAPGKVGVFIRSGGEIWFQVAGDADWQLLAGATQTDPNASPSALAAASLRTGRIDVFVCASREGDDYPLLHRFYDAGEWSNEWIKTSSSSYKIGNISATSTRGVVFVGKQDVATGFNVLAYPRN